MSLFLKIVSGIYLLLIWLIFLIVVLVTPGTRLPTFGYDDIGTGAPLVFFFICLSLSIPAAVLYAFGQIVGDIRASRNHLEAMRAYYEPRQL